MHFASFNSMYDKGALTLIPDQNCHTCMIDIRELSFSYGGKNVIDHLTFTIYERDFIGMIGANGAGKSTLLKLIVGLIKPTEGEITIFGDKLRDFKHWERIGYVPQKNSFNPLFPATVKDVVLSGLYSRKKMFRRVTKEDMKKAEDALQVMGISDLSDHRIGQLSGGQQQRAFLARAFINKPDLLILDEPTVGIDAETQEDFFRLIRHMHQHHHITFLMVSHDVEMMKSYLGEAPIYTSGKIKFYAKHSHDEDCKETDLEHSLNPSADQTTNGGK